MDTQKNRRGILFTFWVCIFAFLFFIFGFCQGATLYLMPSSQTIYEGDSLLIDVRLNTEGKEINSAGIDVIFSDLIEVVDFSEGNSILTLWPKRPSFEQQATGDKQQGIVSFVGGVPQGFVGEGSLLKITFRATSDLPAEENRAQISFGENSKILLNDGQGTPTPITFLEGSYQIIKRSGDLPIISSRTHNDQNKWYPKNSLALRWNWKEENSYSYLLSHSPLDMPDDIPDEPQGELMWIGEMEYRSLEDGIYYFHLIEATKNEQQELVWGPKATFRAMIDTVPPQDFTPEIGQDQAIFEGKYFLSFSTYDGLSGIDHYEVLEISDRQQATGDREQVTGEWKIAQSPYLLEDQTLNSVIKIKAIDKAGNERVAEITPAEKPFPYDRIIALMVGIGIGMGVIWWVFKKLKTKYKRLKTHT